MKINLNTKYRRVRRHIYTEMLPFVRVVHTMEGKLHESHYRQEADVTVMLWGGRHPGPHCDSLQGRSPLSPWMTRLPSYLAGREVFGLGEWGCTARGLGCD